MIRELTIEEKEKLGHYLEIAQDILNITRECGVNAGMPGKPMGVLAPMIGTDQGCYVSDDGGIALVSIDVLPGSFLTPLGRLYLGLK